MADKLSGGCLCGAVRFTATINTLEMGVCHCSQCRHWSGGSFMAVSCKSIEIEDETSLKVYDSSNWAERLFCGQCGTTLIWRMKDGKYPTLAAQAFDDPSVFKFTRQIFIDHKPANYDFANDTKNMTEAEMFAQFAPSAEGDNHG